MSPLEDLAQLGGLVLTRALSSLLHNRSYLTSHILPSRLGSLRSSMEQTRKFRFSNDRG